MPILEIDGIGRVEVGDEFRKLSPEQQNATVEEIRSSRQPTTGRPKVVVTRDDPPPKMGVGEDMLRSADAGLARGVGAMIGMPGELAHWGAQGIDKATQFVGSKLGVDASRPVRQPGGITLPRIDDVHAEMEANKPLHKPQSVAGEVARTVGEFIPGAVAAPGGVVSNAIRYGVVPGLASEAAGQATKGTAVEGPARVAGALTGGVVGAMVGRPSRTSQIIRSQMPEGVTPQMVDQAEALIIDAAQQGIPLSWPEALSQTAGRPILTNTMRHLEAAPASEARMGEFFGNRAQRVEDSAGPQLNAITPANPNPSTIGPAVGTAAEGTINDVRGVINQASEPFYNAAGPIRLSPQEMQQVRALPGYPEARDAVRNDPQLARYVQGLPEDSIGFLDEVKKYLVQSRDNARAPVNQNPNMQRSAGYGLDADAVRDAGLNASRRTPGNPYEIALNVQSQAREQYLQPLLDGPLGKIAARDTTTKKAIDVLFTKNPLPNSADEIATAVAAVAQRNAYAARSLVRAHVEMTFNEATKALQTGANQAGGAKFRTALVGNPQQAANLEAAVSALPNGRQVWDGFNRWLEVLEATGTRQNVGSRTAYNVEFDRALSASSVAGDTAKTVANPISGFQKLVERYERWQLGNNLDELAGVLTDPRSANMLRAIARMPVNSPAARNAAIRISELSESAIAPRREPPNQARR